MTIPTPARPDHRNLRALSALTDRLDDCRTGLPAEPSLARMDAARFSELLSLRAVDELLADNGLRYPLFTMSKDGTRIPGAAYTNAQRTPMSVTRDLADLTAVRDRLAGGATLILEQLHRASRPIADFCRRLGYELGRPIGANAYLTPADSQGFGIHYDTHGAFILQITGRKTWELHHPIEPWPLEDQRWKESMLTAEDRRDLKERGPFARYELVPGDVLWIPRGWLHEVFTTEDAPSLHLTLSVPEISRHWLAMKAMESLAEQEEFRRELPLDALASTKRAREESELVVKALTEWLAGHDVAAVADRAISALRTVWYPTRVSPVASALLDDAELQEAAGVMTIREAVLGFESLGDGRLTIQVGDRDCVLDGTAAEFVGALLAADDPTPAPVDRYIASLGPDGHNVLRRLLAEGIVELV